MNTNTLIEAIKDEVNVAYTDNAALSLRTSKSDLLDFFALGGALRARAAGDVEKMFSLAFAEDKLLALKTLAYLRDIRGGIGERKIFRILLNYLGKNYPELVKKNLKALIEYARFDDFYALFDTPVEQDVLKLFKTQLNKDLKAKKDDSISLLGKWLSSCNTSSEKTRQEAYKIRKYLKMDERTYRKTLAGLRKRIDVVEKKMCANLWPKINYSQVPSKATLIYRKAFAKHDSERYKKWQEDVKAGKKEIKASTLFPYDIVERAFAADNTDKTLDLQWNALPDYCKDNPNPRGIVVADVSGSMNGRPMAIAISLAMYFAERNKGVFNNSFITFSAQPDLVQIKGDTIIEKARNIKDADWGMNTNVQAVFDLILNTAVKNSIKESEMPNALYIISDMQFDVATSNNDKRNFEVIEEKYEAAGYKRPKLVFWNVNSFCHELPVSKDEINTVLVSGASPVVFKTVMSGSTPYQVMINTLNQKRYSLVKV